jgi:hypothetical protein
VRAAKGYERRNRDTNAIVIKQYSQNRHSGGEEDEQANTHVRQG